jgi:hypothetical protein
MEPRPGVCRNSDVPTQLNLGAIMSTTFLAVLILVTTAAVVGALFIVMWLERTSGRESSVAFAGGGVLAVWAVGTAVLASRGVFFPPDANSAPAVGVDLALVLVGLTVALATSGSLRRLLVNQRNLIRLNVWRLLGVVFLVLMVDGQVPALWALPTGIGDILVGATAFWVASQLDAPNGRRRAVIFNLFGLADLIVAIGLGMATSPGPFHVFQTTPTSELLTHFPMVLVPTFLVPLAVMIHVISLWQFSGRAWAPSADRGALAKGVDLSRRDSSI